MWPSGLDSTKGVRLELTDSRYLMGFPARVRTPSSASRYQLLAPAVYETRLPGSIPFPFDRDSMNASIGTAVRDKSLLSPREV